MTIRKSFWSPERASFALKLALRHLGLSGLVALLVAALVFVVWYPDPLARIVGVGRIYLILLAVDVLCGPLLTLVLASPHKPRRELLLDISMVVFIQLAALAYGLHAVANARPVAVVFEKDRLVVVRASELEHADFTSALPPFNTLPWTGPYWVGIRNARDNTEYLNSLELSLQGLGPSLRPDWWQPYEHSVPELMQRSHPLSNLIDRFPEHKPAILETVENTSHALESLRYLPMVTASTADWTAVIDEQGRLVSALNLDSL